MEKITYPALKFGSSCSPSAMPKIIKRIKAYEIAMSCGGGMGGSFWEEYIVDDEGVFPSNTIITRTNILGEEVIINTSFMVKAEPIDVLIIEHDTTEHTNYHQRNVTNRTLSTMYPFTLIKSVKSPIGTMIGKAFARRRNLLSHCPMWMVSAYDKSYPRFIIF